MYYQSLAMKLGMQTNDTMIQNQSKFGGMNMRTGKVRGNF